MTLEVVSLQTMMPGLGHRWYSYGTQTFDAEPLPGDRVEVMRGLSLTVKRRRFEGGKLTAVEVG